ncbi:hypothetical protein [Streptomyces calvus]|uniref:hypothetical protein n=1 Tax=Streptomyces calvus TaxID=67282 RepID=UPI00371CB984
MGEQPRRRDPKLARTDFESMTHEQLAALLDSASSEGASHLAVKLSKAASTITKIGDDLMTYTKGLEWRGEGGDAFRDWGGQTAGATLRLGQYAEVASRWMATVAQAVAEAKAALPDTSETTRAEADLADAKKSLAAAQAPDARNDPEARKLAQTAQSDAAAAQQRMEAARAEAVQQLRKLAQTYEYSAHQVNSVQPPTFSPPSMHVDAPWSTESQYVATGPDVGARTPSAASTYSPGHSAGAHATDQPTPRMATEPVTPRDDDGRPGASRSASMEIDGVAMPQTTTPGDARAHGPQPGAPRPEGMPSVQPGLAAPSFSGTGNGAVRPIATPPLSGMRPPLLPGQGTPNGSMQRSPRETGIVGGRPVPPNPGRPSGSIPRGTVIGSGGVQGHTPMMRGLGGPLMSGGHSGAGQTGGAGGRRLASESGGIVGNRPVQREGATSRPFTPGGSGLVRPANSAGTPHATVSGRTSPPRQANPPSSRENELHGQRPDYLVEEEETWSPGNRRPLPRVVD